MAYSRIKHLIGSTADWVNANPVLLAGEIGYEQTTSGVWRSKIGNGSDRWNTLPYSSVDLTHTANLPVFTTSAGLLQTKSIEEAKSALGIQVASNEEAIAGTDDVKYMTPARVKRAAGVTPATAALYGLEADAWPGDILEIIASRIEDVAGCQVYIKATLPNGQPAANCQISGLPGGVRSTRTGKDGRLIVFIPTETTSITISMSGYIDATGVPVTISTPSGQSVFVELTSIAEPTMQKTITTSATGLLFSEAVDTIDVFCVGAGGGGVNAGTAGGGGYTTTVLNIPRPAAPENAVIGAGVASGRGGTTSFCGVSAAGGYQGGGSTDSPGGSGGSGGGGHGYGSGSTYTNGGSGGSNGSNGGQGHSGSPGGTGQGRTTRAFEEPGGTLYAGGGAGIAGSGKTNGTPGAGGGGAVNQNGAANTGGGGGSGNTSGGSGIIIVRWRYKPA